MKLKAYKFSQKNLNSVWVPFGIVMIFLLAASTWNLKKAAGVRQEIQDRRLLCGEICDNMEAAAGYLSEEARNYVITGNQDYLDRYWDEVHTGTRREEGIIKLEELGVSDDRIRLLKSAKDYSDLLIYLETRAMRLAADAFEASELSLPPEVNEYVLNIAEKSMSPKEKHAAAVELLFSGEYLSEKEVIGQYTRQFLRLVEDELDKELKRADQRVSSALTFQWVLQAAAVLLFLLMVLSYYYLIIQPALSYHRCLMKEDKGQLEPAGVQEIYMLGNSINHALKARDDFLASVSHEIRTPLNSVIGYETLLEQTKLDYLQKEYVSCMKHASDQLLEMASHILDYARLESTRLKLSDEEWFPEGFLRYLKYSFRHLAAEKNLELKLHIEENMPSVLLGDEGKIRQIAGNLLSNAVKFTEKGGIKVTLMWEGNPGSAGMGILRLVVEDTGPGIKPEDLERIFEPFEQAGAAETGQHGGTGLGLPICRSLAELMGGTIKAESTGGGSTFIVQLPQKEGVGEKKRQKNHVERTGKRVLLAEDNQVNQSMQIRLLTSLGLSVEAASDGEKAVKLFEKGKFDLILMDLRMPVMNGYEAATKIRSYEKEVLEESGGKNAPYSHVPIIALTADGDGKMWNRARDAGMDGILIKPAEFEMMKEVIGRFIDLEVEPGMALPRLQEELEQIYCKAHTEDFHNLVCLSEKGEFKEMSELLHKLKGASAAVGAEDIRAVCYTIEERLKNSRTQGLTEMAREAEEKFEEWKQSHPEAEGEHGQNTGMPAKAGMAETINAWGQAVSRGEFRAMSQWKENFLDFSAFFGPQKTEALERALERYDYQTVLDLLEGR